MKDDEGDVHCGMEMFRSFCFARSLASWRAIDAAFRSILPRKPGDIIQIALRRISFEPACPLVIRDGKAHRAEPERREIFHDPPVLHRPARQAIHSAGIDQPHVRGISPLTKKWQR